MKDKVSDMRRHLVAMMERLSDESVKGRDREVVIESARAMSGLVKEAVSTVRLELDAIDIMAKTGMIPDSVDSPQNVLEHVGNVRNFPGRKTA